MSSLTPSLQLKSWDATDPFLMADFNDNNDILDQNPGVHTCTSTSLPPWTAAQAGRLAWLTDQHRMLEWTGTDWREPQNAPLGWMFGLDVNQYIAPGATATYPAIQNLTVTRPGRLFLVTQFTLMSNTFGYISSLCTGSINGATAAYGSIANFSFPKITGLDQGADIRSATSMVSAAVNPGIVTIGATLRTVLPWTTASVLVASLTSHAILVNG